MPHSSATYLSESTTCERKSGPFFPLSLVVTLCLAAVPGFGQRTKPAPDPLLPPASKAPAAADAAPADKAAGQKPGEGGGGPGGRRRRAGGGEGGNAPDAKTETAYDFHLIGPDGKDVPLSDYKDKYLLVVNLGRKSSYNDQLPALIKLNDTYKSKGLIVIGIPSNEFGAAEPGTQADILKAYADAKVDFPIMGLSKLTGDDALPLYTYLIKGTGGAVAWNYTKFIIDKKGKAVAWLDSDVTPDSPEMVSTIEEVLDGTYKPKKEPAAGGRPGAGMKAAN